MIVVFSMFPFRSVASLLVCVELCFFLKIPLLLGVVLVCLYFDFYKSSVLKVIFGVIKKTTQCLLYKYFSDMGFYNCFIRGLLTRTNHLPLLKKGVFRKPNWVRDFILLISLTFR